MEILGRSLLLAEDGDLMTDERMIEDEQIIVLVEHFLANLLFPVKDFTL